MLHSNVAANEVNDNIKQNYNEKAKNTGNVMQRQFTNTYDLRAFNNWIKSVLLQLYTSEMCEKIEKCLDLRKGDYTNKLLHVLDIGCGKGQDVKKFKFSRVKYMVATDFSQECLKTYEERWNSENQPYRLYTTCQNFTSLDFYSAIEHSYYDMVTAQFCFHYMFGSQTGLNNGLASILSNLLIGGVFLATIPDSYTILKKLKEKGIKVPDGYLVRNKFFSIKFPHLNFKTPYGNQYGFYLENAIGKKNDQGEIQYVNEWLISLDHLEHLLDAHGVKLEKTWNFLEFYNDYKYKFKDLLSKFKFGYNPGESMDPQLWEVAHLYRVIVCRKVSKGRSINEFGLSARNKACEKEIRRKHFDNPRKFQKNQHNHNHDKNGGFNQRRNGESSYRGNDAHDSYRGSNEQHSSRYGRKQYNGNHSRSREHRNY